MMLFSQYCRIESKAGGVTASRRQMIRAAHTKLSKLGRSFERREARHKWLKQILEYHDANKAMIRKHRF